VARICLAWLYAITKYGYPTPVDRMLNAFEDAARLGFRYVEVEAVGERNLREVEERRSELRAKLSELGLDLVNFAGIFREIVSPDSSEREKGVGDAREGRGARRLLRGRDAADRHVHAPARVRGGAPLLLRGCFRRAVQGQG
jgi:sugar phosphate isomerase/epimerase